MLKFVLTFSLISLSAVFSHDDSWTKTGPVPDNSYISYTIALNQRNMDSMKTQLLDISNPSSSNYGKYLERSAILAEIVPPVSEIKMVSEWLVDNNVFLANFIGDAYKCNDTVANVNRMFDVTMYHYEALVPNQVSGGRAISAVRSDTDYVLPEYLTNYVVFVDGISNHLNPLYSPIISRQTAEETVDDVDSGFVTREVIERLYNIKHDHIDFVNTSSAAIEFNGYGYTDKAIKLTQTENGVPLRSVYKDIGINFGGGTESELDMQMLTQVAPDVQLWYINYDHWIYEMAVDLFMRKEVPYVISISYGWAEWAQCQIIKCTNDTSAIYIDRTNNELVKLGLRGISVLVASGDAGAPGRTNEDCGDNKFIGHIINPIFPGSSPWVTSVGGTYIMKSKEHHNETFHTPICKKYKCATGNRTKVVNFDAVSWTSGGGFSTYGDDSHWGWQKSYVEQYLNSGVSLPNSYWWNKKGRGYPDVALVAHNCAVYGAMGIDQFMGVDGTSCSTPIFAAIVALLNDHRHTKNMPRLGYLNPLLYSMASVKADTFYPVHSGNNYCTEQKCCSADFGFSTPPVRTLWNPVSGLGSPNVEEIKNYLDTLA